MLKTILAFVLVGVAAIATTTVSNQAAIGASTPCLTPVCADVTDCDGLLACIDGVCEACGTDDDCGNGYYCDEGQCHAGPDPELCQVYAPACDNDPTVTCSEECDHGCGIGSPLGPVGQCMGLPPGEELACYGGVCLPGGVGTCTTNEECPAELSCLCGTCVDTDVPYFDGAWSVACTFEGGHGGPGLPPSPDEPGIPGSPGGPGVPPPPVP